MKKREATEHGRMISIKPKKKKGSPYAAQDSIGLWHFKPRPEMELNTPVMEHAVTKVKFFAPTYTCPIHGEVESVSRNYQPERMTCTHGLSCGHTLFITRLVSTLKKASDGTIFSDTSFPRNWNHRGWLMEFANTLLVQPS